jgi:DNA/RNA-binding domain of Phe-tRNA-synthetase-like protein
MDEMAVVPPYLFRSGQAGEAYESLRGPFNLEGKPLLLDQGGPCDAPITGSRRVCVGTGTQRVWLVAYLPADAVSTETATQEMAALIGKATVAGIRVEAMSKGVA